MPKSEKDEMLSALTTRMFTAMLEDIIMDITLESHHEVLRSRAVCPVCHTRCNSVHIPGPSTTPRAGSPMAVDAKPAKGSTTEADGGTPTSAKADSIINLDCMNCDRQIASNRYAQHLSACMGIATGTRRAPSRVNNVKSQGSAEPGRSASPASEVGYISDENKGTKGKGKSKSKREDEAEFNLKRKRVNPSSTWTSYSSDDAFDDKLSSPQITPTKKQKKKPAGSPVSRIKSESDASGIISNTQPLPPTNSISRVPSKLRDSSIASFRERSPSGASSRSSSPGVASVHTTASSSFSGPSHSPSFAGKGIVNKPPKKVVGTGPPRRLSPPKPPPPPIQDYTVDVEGEETGSSTDTDSS